MENNLIDWIQNWFLENCDEDWEHMDGIKIETLDNPGWMVKIYLPEVNEEYSYPVVNIRSDLSDNDWYNYQIKNNYFIGYSDPKKLAFLLGEFKNYIESIKE